MNDDLRSFLNEQAVFLEKKRIKAVRLNYLFRIIKPLRTLLKGVFFTLLIINFIVPVLIPAVIITGIALFLLSIINDPKKVFESKLKKHVLPTIFKHINETFQYAPHGYNGETLKQSQFLSKGFFANTFEIEGEDYVKGKIGTIDVEFFEITFFKKQINYTKTIGGCLLSIILIPIIIIKNIFTGDNDSPDDTIVGIVEEINIFFSGFFMHADFHKEFNGKIFMLPKKNDRLKDKLYEMLDPKTLSKINVENPFINDKYNIYTSDVQTGYYVLSPNLIDRIHTISESEKALPIVSFINGKMYFIIPWDKNFFKASITTKIKDGDYFIPYINEINSFEKIIKDLNLDTRIWTKD